jgi:hypothetical protein
MMMIIIIMIMIMSHVCPGEAVLKECVVAGTDLINLREYASSGQPYFVAPLTEHIKVDNGLIDLVLHTKAMSTDLVLHTKAMSIDLVLHTKAMSIDLVLHTKAMSIDLVLHTGGVD